MTSTPRATFSAVEASISSVPSAEFTGREASSVRSDSDSVYSGEEKSAGGETRSVISRFGAGLGRGFELGFGLLVMDEDLTGKARERHSSDVANSGDQLNVFRGRISNISNAVASAIESTKSILRCQNRIHGLYCAAIGLPKNKACQMKRFKSARVFRSFFCNKVNIEAGIVLKNRRPAFVLPLRNWHCVDAPA